MKIGALTKYLNYKQLKGGRTVRKTLVIMMILGVLIMSAACGQKTASNQAGAGSQAQRQGPVPGPGQGQAQAQAVTAVKLEKTNLTGTISVVGQLNPQQEVKVAPKSSGKVEQVFADVGQEASAGTVLMRLNNSDLQIQLQKTQIQLNDAKVKLDRYKTLYESGGVSKLDYETAQSAYNTLRVTFEQNQNDLANSEVCSPIEGTVTARNVNPGEFAGSTTAAFTVVNLDKVLVIANLMEDEVNYIKIGQAVEVTVPAVTDKAFPGGISKVSPYADSKSKAYPVWVLVDNPEHFLKPGMFAAAKMTYNKREGVMVVPNDSIVDRNGKKVVYIVVDNKAAEKPVKLGASLGGKTEITEGLNSGDVLITNGLATMRDGKAVSVAGEAGKKGN